MSRTSTLILIGLLVILAPFSGFPISFRTFLEVIFGAAVAGIGLAMRAQEAREMRSRAETPPASATAPATASQSTNSSPESVSHEPHGVSPI